MTDINNNEIAFNIKRTNSILIHSNDRDFNIILIIMFYKVPTFYSKCKIFIRFRTTVKQL